MDGSTFGPIVGASVRRLPIKVPKFGSRLSCLAIAHSRLCVEQKEQIEFFQEFSHLQIAKRPAITRKPLINLAPEVGLEPTTP